VSGIQQNAFRFAKKKEDLRTKHLLHVTRTGSSIVAEAITKRSLSVMRILCGDGISIHYIDAVAGPILHMAHLPGHCRRSEAHAANYPTRRRRRGNEKHPSMRRDRSRKALGKRSIRTFSLVCCMLWYVQYLIF